MGKDLSFGVAQVGPLSTTRVINYRKHSVTINKTHSVLAETGQRKNYHYKQNFHGKQMLFAAIF